MFERVGGSWYQLQMLVVSDGAASNWFGVSISLSFNGSAIVVGAYGKALAGVANGGSAYVFARNRKACGWNNNNCLLQMA